MKQYGFDKSTVWAFLSLYFLLALGSILMSAALLGGAVWLVVTILKAMGVL